VLDLLLHWCQCEYITRGGSNTTYTSEPIEVVRREAEVSKCGFLGILYSFRRVKSLYDKTS
jgi:hypothetical protein